MLTILKKWLYGEGEEAKYFTLEQLLSMREILSMDSEDFSEYITGYNCDSYADTSCDIMEDIYRQACQYKGEDKVEYCYSLCMEEETFLTCYTTYRLWNSNHTEEEALRCWKESCFCTLEEIAERIG